MRGPRGLCTSRRGRRRRRGDAVRRLARLDGLDRGSPCGVDVARNTDVRSCVTYAGMQVVWHTGPEVMAAAALQVLTHAEGMPRHRRMGPAVTKSARAHVERESVSDRDERRP